MQNQLTTKFSTKGTTFKQILRKGICGNHQNPAEKKPAHRKTAANTLAKNKILFL